MKDVLITRGSWVMIATIIISIFYIRLVHGSGRSGLKEGLINFYQAQFRPFRLLARPETGPTG
jgi:hypothetical protein